MVIGNMRRRTLLRVGGSIAFVALAGCSGGDGDESETTTTEEESSGDTTETSGGGDVSFSVKPSANQLDWGEDYSVDVTVQSGDESVQLATGIVYQTEDDSEWAGSFGNTEKMWQLDEGESQTVTFDIEPPAVGELKLGLYDAVSEQVVEEWELTVSRPIAALGETNSYYDGLDMTVDAEVHESLEFELEYGGDQNDAESGMFSVGVKDGKWVKVIITAENTNQEGEVGLPGKTEFGGIVGQGTQLKQNQPRALGEGVGEGTIYEIGDGPENIGDAWMEMHKGGNAQQDGYWYPPSELVYGAVEKGWIAYAVQEDLSDDAKIEIRLDRQSGIDVRAIWTNE
jgi:hypothetical protein